jgi:hypothetical protein
VNFTHPVWSDVSVDSFMPSDGMVLVWHGAGQVCVCGCVHSASSGIHCHNLLTMMASGVGGSPCWSHRAT